MLLIRYNLSTPNLYEFIYVCYARSIANDGTSKIFWFFGGILGAGWCGWRAESAHLLVQFSRMQSRSQCVNQPGKLCVNSLITMCLGETIISECFYTKEETTHTHTHRKLNCHIYRSDSWIVAFCFFNTLAFYVKCACCLGDIMPQTTVWKTQSLFFSPISSYWV